MNSILFAMMQQGRPGPKLETERIPESDFVKEMLGHLLYLSPAVILTFLGLLVLIYDFTILRKKPSAERQARLGAMSLLGVFAAILAQLWVMLPPDPYMGLNAASTYVAMFGDTISADGVSCWMNLTVLVLMALVIVQSLSFSFTEHWGEYFALMCWSAVGMMFLIAAEELITLFLTLETMTLCLYMMASFEKTRRRSAEAGLKYFVYGSVSSALFLFGLSLIYGLTGSTRLDSIKTALEGGSTAMTGLSGNIAGATAVLLVLVGFGFKIAAVPFHQWSPDTYEGAPAPVTSWIATGSKIASFAAMIKVLVGALAPWAMKGENTTSPGWIGIVATISAITMTYGNFAALAQKNLKRMLAYSSIAHAGYMLVGVLAASLSKSQYMQSGPVFFYLIVYGFTTVGAFSVAAWLVREKGTDEIEDLNGIGYRYPMMAVCIVLLMLSLIGMPPLAGFFGKLYMFMEAMNVRGKAQLPLTWLVMLGLFNSVVSAYYYVRVLKAMFLREGSGTPLGKPGPGVAIPILTATFVAVALGIFPSLLVNAMNAASKTRPTPTAKAAQPVFDAQGNRVLTPEQQRAEDAYQARLKALRDSGKTLQASGGGGEAPPPKNATKKKGGGSSKKKQGQDGGSPEPESKKDAAKP